MSELSFSIHFYFNKCVGTVGFARKFVWVEKPEWIFWWTQYIKIAVRFLEHCSEQNKLASYAHEAYIWET